MTPSDEDEDGDKITVCSDDELAAMLTFVSVCVLEMEQTSTMCALCVWGGGGIVGAVWGRGGIVCVGGGGIVGTVWGRGGIVGIVELLQCQWRVSQYGLNVEPLAIYPKGESHTHTHTHIHTHAHANCHHHIHTLSKSMEKSPSTGGEHQSPSHS